MTQLPRHMLFLAGAVFLTLFAINLWLRPDFELQLSPTSYGVAPNGYKAAFDLASELGLPVTRSYLAPRQQPLTKTILLISPSLLDPDSNSGDSKAHELLDWVRSGGTAIVFGAKNSNWKRLDVDADAVAGTAHAAITGDLTKVMRRLSVPGLLHFEAISKTLRIRLRADDLPFAIERTLGKGHLIAIADGRFLQAPGQRNNDEPDGGDAEDGLEDHVDVSMPHPENH
jgi:hypothetical protein